MKNQRNILIWIVASLILAVGIQSCDDMEKFEPLGANSIADATPPNAIFTYAQGVGLAEEWKTYTFANLSSSATNYHWDFGDGNTSTAGIGEDLDGENTYSGEGTWTVTLTASDALGVTSVYTEIIEVVEPEAPAVPDPTLVNTDFDKIPKSSGSDCSCSAWINRDIGDQAESSSGNGGSDNVLKWDNNEPDHIYQEFEVVPNTDYLITVVTSFKDPIGGSYPSVLELRVLAGSGYEDGYTPTYYTEAVEFPQGNSTTGYWGYRSISQVEDATNNLLVETQDNPSTQDYLTSAYAFNSGANDSVALFGRGIGGPATGGGGDFGYNSGDEEIRADSVTITAVN